MLRLVFVGGAYSWRIILPIRHIIHIDLDAFFASVEQRDNPQMRGRAVLVGGTPGEHGVVAAASYEARRFGIHSAMPMRTALQRCPYAVVVPPRKDHYRSVSTKIRKILHRYTNLVEPVALDECYLDVTDSERAVGDISYAIGVAQQIKERIWCELALTASAGVAPNKFLAKIASDMQKPDGLFVLRPYQVEPFLRELPVNKIGGVGAVTEKRLATLGIEFIGQLRQCSLALLVHEFGKMGVYLYHVARGIDNRPVDPSDKRNSISREKTFASNIFSIEGIRCALQDLSNSVFTVLESEGLRGRTTRLKVRYPNFRVVTRSQTLATGIRTKDTIHRRVVELLGKTEAKSLGVSLIGVSISQWEHERPRQLQLFE